ncbi:hypothetical protein [Anaerotignum sp.]
MLKIIVPIIPYTFYHPVPASFFAVGKGDGNFMISFDFAFNGMAGDHFFVQDDHIAQADGQNHFSAGNHDLAVGIIPGNDFIFCT